MKKLILAILVLFSAKVASQKNDPLRFNPEKYTMETLSEGGKTFKVRAYEGIVYIAHPVEAEYQQLNLYVPIEYFEGKSIGKFSAKTAPVFFPNQIGGYMPASPAKATAPGRSNRANAVAVALSKGFVVASAGARGRTSATGKAPAALVDLKAAVRYLKYNADLIPGDMNKIISNGTSAGGALSVLLGASGNDKRYTPYLKAIGAAETTDHIYAVSAYCPITNLENADMAYEWQFNGVSSYKKIMLASLDYSTKRQYLQGRLNDQEEEISAELKNAFPAYLNGLKLTDARGTKLVLNNKQEGSFKELLKQKVIESAEKALQIGVDLTKYNFLTLSNNKITDLDWNKYVAYMGRSKTPPAFDALDMSAGENQLFGDEKTDTKHFSLYTFKKSVGMGTLADPKVVSLMNPMTFIGKSNPNLPKYWRIRHGTKDSDTSLAISAILATTLANAGATVDYELAWDKPHSGDYDLEELFSWMML